MADPVLYPDTIQKTLADGTRVLSGYVDADAGETPGVSEPSQRACGAVPVEGLCVTAPAVLWRPRALPKGAVGRVNLMLSWASVAGRRN